MPTSVLVVLTITAFLSAVAVFGVTLATFRSMNVSLKTPILELRYGPGEVPQTGEGPTLSATSLTDAEILMALAHVENFADVQNTLLAEMESRIRAGVQT